MPQEAICPAPFKLEWREYQDAAPGPRQVRVKAEFAAAKHGTELAIYGGAVTTRGHFDEDWRGGPAFAELLFVRSHSAKHVGGAHFVD